MANTHGSDHLRRLQKEIRESIRRNHPNPDRIGCPNSTVLRQLALDELLMGHPAYAHVMECYPCYEELMALFETRVSDVESSD